VEWLLDFIKNHKVQALIVGWVLLIIIALVIVIIINAVNQAGKAPDGSRVIDEIDPASQRLVQVDGTFTSNGEDDPIANGPTFVGWDILTRYNSDEWSQTIKRMVNMYSYENGIAIWRVSIFANSLSQTFDQQPYGALTTKSTFRIMLNRDEKELSAEVIDNNSTRALSIKLFDTNRNLVWEKSTTMSNRTTEFSTDQIPAGLVRLMRGDEESAIEVRFLSANNRVWSLILIGSAGYSVSASLVPGFDPPKPNTNTSVLVFFACPTANNVSDFSQCQIYRYQQ